MLRSISTPKRPNAPRRVSLSAGGKKIGSELLFRSHKEKIEQMAAWDANPFVGMMLTREEGNAFRLGQP
jgi:hypothetical protein